MYVTFQKSHHIYVAIICCSAFLFTLFDNGEQPNNCTSRFKDTFPFIDWIGPVHTCKFLNKEIAGGSMRRKPAGGCRDQYQRPLTHRTQRPWPILSATFKCITARLEDFIAVLRGIICMQCPIDLYLYGPKTYGQVSIYLPI